MSTPNEIKTPPTQFENSNPITFFGNPILEAQFKTLQRIGGYVGGLESTVKQLDLSQGSPEDALRSLRSIAADVKAGGV